jgi:hypothetical protein
MPVRDPPGARSVERKRVGDVGRSDSKATGTGVTINTYRPAGDIDVGSFEFDEPTEAEVERRRREAHGS